MTSDETLRTMAERIEQMAENRRYAEAGVIPYRFLAGQPDPSSELQRQLLNAVHRAEMSDHVGRRR